MSNVVMVEQLPEMVTPPTEQLDRYQIEAQARYLIENRQSQPEVTIQRGEYRDNARTALMEALTASGHLSKVEISGSVEEINQQVMCRLLNGWSDALPVHEQKRRFAEICEELVIQQTHHDIVAGLLPPETAVGIISDCPTVEMPGIGYRYKNKKGMVRSTHLQRNDDGSYTRVIEQVSRSNSGWETSQGFLSACGLDMQSDNTPIDLAVLSTPFLYTTRDFIDGVVDVQRQLDRYAGQNIRYGEKIADNPNHVDYHLLRQESQRREAEIECYIDGLADLEAQLAEFTQNGSMSGQESLQIFQQEVGRILSAICTLSPEYAEATFGAASVPIFYQAAELAMRGELEQARNLVEANGHMKETITFCGMSFSIEEAEKMGINVNKFGKLVEEGKENWKWKKGVCQVSACPTRPGKTEVGPCSVCRTCQSMFDKGRDPTKPSILQKAIQKKKIVLPIDPKTKEDSTIKAA